MPTALRIRSHPGMRAAGDEPDPRKSYLDRLVKLIPAEVVGLYLAGKSAIQASYPQKADMPPVPATPAEIRWWVIWTLFCLFAVFLVRAWATSDKPRKVPVEWPAVCLAAASFLVWVYSFGDVFERLDYWSPLPSSLLVLAWTFSVPFFYQEKQTDPQPIPQPVPQPVQPRAAPRRPFEMGDAELCVLYSAEDLRGHSVDPTDTVSDEFDTAKRIRRLLGRIQDKIYRDYNIWVELADGSEDDMDERGKDTFGGLAAWVFEKVQGR